MKINYSEQKYVVSGRSGYSLSEFLSLSKTKYRDYKDFEKAVITHESLKDFGDFVNSCWEDIKPVTVEDAFKLTNTEERRIYFDCIGVESLFKSLKPKLKDKQVITKKRMKWDEEGNPVEHTFDDVYELYEIEGKKLFEKNAWGSEANPVYAVRCWCTTTNREYWLYVNNEAATGHRWLFEDRKAEFDAIRAIAWTVRIDVPIKSVEKIYRQGDIIVVKIKDKTAKDNYTNPYHLSKEDYLNLMYSET
jgi:hypothetical protein